MFPRIRQGWLIPMLLVLGCGDDVYAPEATTAPEPLLLNLLISGGSELNPTFEASLGRYSVISDSEDESLVITPMVDPENSVTVEGVEVPSGSSHTASVSPGEGVEIVVTNADGDTGSYEIFFLPADFPQLTVTVPREEASDEVTYLTLGTWLIIIDDNGVPFFYKREQGRVMDFKVHPTGEYSYGVGTGERNEFNRRENIIVVLDGNFNEVDRVSTVGLNHTDTHEFLIRPNGNYVLLGYHGVLRDMTGFGGTSSQLVEESVFQEVTRDRTVVFQWTSWDGIPFTDALRSKTEYAHVNSIFIDDDENWIISARAVSQVLKIERSSGDVLWKLGGKSNEFVFINDPYSGLCGQHTASILSNGNLLVFDNGQPCIPGSAENRGELTRIAEFQIDTVASTATLVWSYSQDGAYTTSKGSAQRLANGNTLIGWGTGVPITATEVDAEGKTVWELTGLLDGKSVGTYRAFRGPNCCLDPL